MKTNPKRFVALGTLPMQAPDLAIRELKRCVKVILSFHYYLCMQACINIQELGFPGVQIGSHINEWNLDAPELISFFAASSLHLRVCRYVVYFLVYFL